MNRVQLFLCLSLWLPSLGWGGPHILFLIGEHEYETWRTVPAFFEEELRPQGFEGTFIVAPREGPESNEFPGMAEALERCDLIFLSVRRRAPREADLTALRAALEAGKPLVGIRTASHAFHLRGEAPPEGHALWERFDPEVLAGNYRGHLKDERAVISVAAGAETSPLLAGVSLEATDRLYQSGPLGESATLLLTAQAEGHDVEPIAWTNRYGPGSARIFYTSLGAVEDFETPGFRRLLLNAIDWSLEKD